MRRSRRGADKLAAERLESSQSLTDQDVLDALRQWYFKPNKTRVNVLPVGTTFVHSDTLGVVRSRTGHVVPTSPTMKNLNLLRLLARWLAEQQHFEAPFPWTSINVNFGYAARRHRDSGNSGVSVTKAFGEFTGGLLLYWPDDDGTAPLHELSPKQSICVDTKRQMALFDGHRAHEVTPFTGERYSLVLDSYKWLFVCGVLCWFLVPGDFQRSVVISGPSFEVILVLHTVTHFVFCCLSRTPNKPSQPVSPQTRGHL